MTNPDAPRVLFQGSLAIARDLEKVLQRGAVQAWTVPLPGGG